MTAALLINVQLWVVYFQKDLENQSICRKGSWMIKTTEAMTYDDDLGTEKSSGWESSRSGLLDVRS